MSEEEEVVVVGWTGSCSGMSVSDSSRILGWGGELVARQSSSKIAETSVSLQNSSSPWSTSLCSDSVPKVELEAPDPPDFSGSGPVIIKICSKFCCSVWVGLIGFCGRVSSVVVGVGDFAYLITSFPKFSGPASAFLEDFFLDNVF